MFSCYVKYESLFSQGPGNRYYIHLVSQFCLQVTYSSYFFKTPFLFVVYQNWLFILAIVMCKTSIFMEDFDAWNNYPSLSQVIILNIASVDSHILQRTLLHVECHFLPSLNLKHCTLVQILKNKIILSNT